MKFYLNNKDKLKSGLFVGLLVLCMCILYNVIIPINNVGVVDYLYYEYESNPISKKIINTYIKIDKKKTSKMWLKRTKMIDIENIPNVQWKEDEDTSLGINSIYCLDSHAEDVRDLLLPEWELTHDTKNWWRSHFTGEYMWNPSLSSIPKYQMEKSDSSLHIVTGDKLDTWVYLVSKHPQSRTYAIEFDFITHTETQETLQLCFSSSSLAQRLRFNIENNKTLKFDVVDKGYFTYWSMRKEWDKFKQPLQLPLHKTVRVRLECINNTFIYYIDGKVEMAIKIEDYIPQEMSYWYMIFWNGNKVNEYIEIEIKNLTIYYGIS